MNTFRALYYIFVFVLSLILIIAIDNVFIAGFITIFISISLYIVVGLKRAEKRINLIEESCDPEAFIEATEKQHSITGKNKRIDAYLSVDRSAGYILRGDFEDAIIELDHVDKTKLSTLNGARFIYYVNLATAYYMLGDVEKGNSIYDEIIVNEPIKFKQHLLASRYILLTKYMANHEYDLAMELIEELKSKKTSKRKRVSLAYNEGIIFLDRDQKSKALARFKEVVSKGNKLYIVKKSKEHIRNLETCID